MLKIETPEEFAGKLIYDWREVRSKDENPPLLAVVIAEHVTARDAAIRAECRECTFTKCELYPYRLGHAVNRAKRELTDEQRQILRQRMAAMRNTVK